VVGDEGGTCRSAISACLDLASPPPQPPPSAPLRVYLEGLVEGLAVSAARGVSVEHRVRDYLAGRGPQSNQQQVCSPTVYCVLVLRPPSGFKLKRRSMLILLAMCRGVRLRGSFDGAWAPVGRNVSRAHAARQ
jgi:hypothetical protein